MNILAFWVDTVEPIIVLYFFWSYVWDFPFFPNSLQQSISPAKILWILSLTSSISAVAPNFKCFPYVDLRV